MITIRWATAARVFATLTALCLLPAAPARADEFPLFKGSAAGIWKTTILFGAAVRNGSPQADLVGAGAGQPGSEVSTGGIEFPGASGAVGVNDDSNLNFSKGSLVSMPVTVVSDFRLQYKASGFFVRVRAWYDMGLEAKSVAHGNVTGKYVQNTQLDDTNWTGAARFHGVDVYDAFYFGNYDVGEGKLQLRLGRQSLSWGEGLFYPGINAFNPFDAAWLAMPGAALVNGGQIPVARAYANLALPRGWTVDGFYNFEFRATNIAGCGTWNSMVDNAMQPGCNTASAGGLRDDVSATLIRTKSYFMGQLPAAGFYPDGGPDNPYATKKPQWHDSGWGVSVHQFIEPIQSEIGVYYASYTNPMPNVSTLNGPRGALDYNVNQMYVGGIKAFAGSVSTGVRNVALSGQVTRTLGQPGQRSFPTLIQGGLQGIGPYADQQNPENFTREYPGYFKFNVTQLQFGATAQIGQILHLSNAQLVAETNMQWATNHPGLEAERIGRYGNFGVGTWNGGNCDPTRQSNGIINKCEVTGFGTPFAWGYKLLAVAALPSDRRGITLTPSFTFGNDPTGYSVDGMIVGSRVFYGASLRADLRQRYFAILGANAYRRGAEFDPMRDRGVYSLIFGINLQ